MRKMLFVFLSMCLILFGTTVPKVHSNSNLPTNSDVLESSLEEVQSSSAVPIQMNVVFGSAGDVFNYVVKASGDGNLTVDTMDCCVEGDQWGLKAKSRKPKAKDQACGSGSTTTFSGPVVLERLKKGKVKLYYCEGVDDFPAGMTIRFSYTGTSFTVTPK